MYKFPIRHMGVDLILKAGGGGGEGATVLKV